MLKVIFMGTPDFAVASLKAIVESEHQVMAVVTAPDKVAGRGRKLNESAVKKFAIEHKIEVLQPTNLKSEVYVEKLKDFNADVYVVVAFRMLPKVVWQIPPKGTFNLHASLLPDYRGAAPINWAIINGENESGVTTFLIDEKIDTGNILLQESIKLELNETAGTLHNKLMTLGSELVLKTLDGLEANNLTPKIQTELLDKKEAPKIKKEDGRINWHENIEKIDQHIRGFSPYPTAWTNLNTENESINLKIYSGNIKYASHPYNIGDVVIENKVFKISTKEGFYLVDELQLAGKKRMVVQDFINGLDRNKTYKVN